jgi:hypothetical protein
MEEKLIGVIKRVSVITNPTLYLYIREARYILLGESDRIKT